jgi:hypothetical protein
MIEVQEGKTFILTAPFLVDGVDTTVSGSQVWDIAPAGIAVLTVNTDGSAEISPVGTPRGEVVVSYKGSAVDATGVTVPDFGTETYNIIDKVVVPPTPVQVQIISTEKV